MQLHSILISNFRSFCGDHVIPVGNLSAFVGKNDAGKSTIFDALAVFFDHPLGKIDPGDICVNASHMGEIRIGCAFSGFPEEVTIDTNNPTTLQNEYLINADGLLEIHCVIPFMDGKVKPRQMFAQANHPSADGVSDLLSKKISDLKKIVKEKAIKCSDMGRCAVLRRAIWDACPDLQLDHRRIPLDKEDAKRIWAKLETYLPYYALFRSDRPSNDEDAEVQDPMKIAVKNAIEQAKEELEGVLGLIEKKTKEVADRTIEKLREMAPDVADELRSKFKQDPKWESVIKLNLLDSNGIPLNKRGSGVRRLVLFGFLRAEAERLRIEQGKKSIIYAIEEPETAQHPDNQEKIVNTLMDLSEKDGVQVMLTTHVPALASFLPIRSLHYVHPADAVNTVDRVVSGADNLRVLETIVNALGVPPQIGIIQHSVRLVVCVEGKHDVSFLTAISRTLQGVNADTIDLENDNRVIVLPIGGVGSLATWATVDYLKKLDLRQIYFIDRDVDNDKKLSAAKSGIENRGGRVFVTEKRAMENYLHPDAVQEAFATLSPPVHVAIQIDDKCKVHEIISASLERGEISPRSIKDVLNTDAASRMTVAHLKKRDGYDEILGWFTAIKEKLEN